MHSAQPEAGEDGLAATATTRSPHCTAGRTEGRNVDDPMPVTSLNRFSVERFLADRMADERSDERTAEAGRPGERVAVDHLSDKLPATLRIPRERIAPERLTLTQDGQPQLVRTPVDLTGSVAGIGERLTGNNAAGASGETGNEDEYDFPDTPSIYLDCGRCFEDFIRTELTFLDFVRDQQDADIHLRINSEGTGNGREYTLRYHGQRSFMNRDNVLRFHSSDNDTNDERRRGLVRYMKLGLMTYLVDTPISSRIDIHVAHTEEGNTQSSEEQDPWNNWVFELGGGASFNARSTRESINLDGSISADRITRDWKIRMNIQGDYERNWFELSDGRTTTTEVRDQSYDGLFARGITEHLSIGLFTEAQSSTFDNIEMQFEASPAIEYNFFPYSDYGERELRLSYRMSPSYTEYIEETIYEQTSEMLYNHRLSLSLDLNQQWGRIRGSVTSSHYLHDFDMNRVSFFSSVDLRLYRGLSLNLRGNYNIINDQIGIPAGDVSDEEALLDIRQQATDFSYWGRIGLSYTFGSIFNNVVNPRF